MATTSVEQKLKMARSLINAATRQQIRERQQEADSTICRCGHRHDRHALSCSVNYTAGHCQETDCQCKWFLMADGRPLESRVM